MASGVTLPANPYNLAKRVLPVRYTGRMDVAVDIEAGIDPAGFAREQTGAYDEAVPDIAKCGDPPGGGHCPQVWPGGGGT